MKTLAFALISASIAGASAPAFGMDMAKHMKMMDSNADGMISKDEFMKHHEEMYDGMKKNSSGMVSMKDMQAMMMKDHGKMAGGKAMKHQGMSKHEGMSKDGSMMNHDAMMKDKAK